MAFRLITDRFKYPRESADLQPKKRDARLPTVRRDSGVDFSPLLDDDKA